MRGEKVIFKFIRVIELIYLRIRDGFAIRVKSIRGGVWRARMEKGCIIIFSVIDRFEGYRWVRIIWLDFVLEILF